MVDALIKPTADDVSRVVSELAEIKDLLREISREILRIERRVKAVIPRSQMPASRGLRSVPRPPMDDEAANRVIQSLRNELSLQGSVETKLRQLTVKPELASIARALGMTNTKLPTKDELIRRIATRLRQSAAVSESLQDDPVRR